MIETFYPSTSGVWEDTVISGVNLSGGNKVLKLEMVGYDNNLKINWLSVSKSELASWKFETDSDTEGWYVGNDVSGFTASNGYLNGTITGTDPQIYSADNLGINITDNKTFSSVMKNGTTAKRAKVNYTTTTDTNFSEAKSFDVILVTDPSINQAFGKYMGYEAGWSGTLKQIRIDPINDDVTNSDTFGLDSFTIYDGNYSYPQ